MVVLASATFLLLLLISGLNAFHLGFLHPSSTVQILVFSALSILIFLLFVTLLVLLLRNILKLLADQRSRVLGSRLRTRMIVGALLISIAPAAVMFAFSYLLMNRSIDRWFSQPVAEIRENSTRIALSLAQYVSLNARAEAESLTRSPSFETAWQASDRQAMVEEIRSHRITLQGGFAIVYRDSSAIASYDVPSSSGPVTVRSWLDTSLDSSEDSSSETPADPLPAVVLQTAHRTDEPVLSIGDGRYTVGMATLGQDGMIVVGLPMPSGLDQAVTEISRGSTQYWSIYRTRRTIRLTYLLLLLMLTALIFFASSWLALYLSKQITRTVEALADAMNEIAEGQYERRVTVSATEELGELVRSFNHMAADLEQNRNLAQSSAEQLSAANLSLETRRRELETILETIPSGVVTLDTGLRIAQANRAFLDLFDLPGNDALAGTPLNAVLPAELTAEIALLERRAQRMGIAANEFELARPDGPLRLTLTLAALDLGYQRRGSILVTEDVTELLRAQRQLAWKQVAQRVAHEIKNPLTPIGLSAERIRRHMDQPRPDSETVIRKCSDVILSSVESMRTLVDQFAVLAEFPAAQPRPEDLNLIVENAIALFHGRLQDIRIEQRLDRTLPLVMVDPQALQRALANLIDNAAEAMQRSLLRMLSISTGYNETHTMAEIVLADTGHGLTEESRERLFLPYFSTKQRGSGLGLSIAAKVIQEHHGAIRAENNTPAGARFIVNLPFAEVAGQDNTPINGTAQHNGKASNGHLSHKPEHGTLLMPPVEESE
ncbi:HAMP domain-containing protein [Silvibacterium dinghuense]|uniref:histidine kinase n=1 Tax=Silvibacterium dinghuense TaxID=1560006 RepID=A0A4Q1SLM3_9BACT|nr:HAMP domain-containing protein [Silvibacterium dinghuense]